MTQRDDSNSAGGHRCDICFKVKADALELPVMQPPGFARTMWVCGDCSRTMAQLEASR